MEKRTTPKEIADGRDCLLGTEEAAKLLGITKSWLFQLCHFRKIPTYHLPGGRKLLFSKTELLSWALSNKRKTISEIESEVK